MAKINHLEMTENLMALNDIEVKKRDRALRRCPEHLYHRGYDAGWQGTAEWYIPLPGPELRQELRRNIFEQGEQA